MRFLRVGLKPCMLHKVLLSRANCRICKRVPMSLMKVVVGPLKAPKHLNDVVNMIWKRTRLCCLHASRHISWNLWHLCLWLDFQAMTKKVACGTKKVLSPKTHFFHGKRLPQVKPPRLRSFLNSLARFRRFWRHRRHKQSVTQNSCRALCRALLVQKGLVKSLACH